ncbi:MAG: helix-turn-helix domain-containing protein [Mediterraneibacter faecis]
MTRKEAAVKLDMKEERLQDLETGRKGLTLGEAIKYADTYNVPLEYIAGRKKVEY